ncbi:MAG: epoxyqueuosine reductase QueH [Deltaproteobacteria bacterium]|jgi:predicted adenine nucleotide alpha hydrolase (AANH) superfamily ATPase|nr:epoxyqueuosine reductase QueH [Deltaproteobacteria bacterium]
MSAFEEGPAAADPPESLLLHVCCGPCAVWPVKALLAKFPKIKLLLWFYNPNVQPLAEFRRRRDGLAFFFACLLGKGGSLSIDFSPPYDQEEFLAMAAKEPLAPGRCLGCYRLRLKAAAQAAREKGFSHFSTTLLFSRKQNHEAVAGAGREAQLGEAAFYYEDFRVGWKEGQAQARAMGLYRQNYCGCVYGAAEQG